MSDETLVEVRRGVYRDSVTLLQISRELGAVHGVQAAQVAMATELNLDVLRTMGFEVPADAKANDMVLAVRAADSAAVARANGLLDEALARAASGSGRGLGERPAPRLLGSAARAAGATLALVSVPGEHAFTEAMDALENGLSVLVFSDNVPVEQEVRLKDEAEQRGLLVMGPDCGTAIVGGAGLGFANAVRPGPVGVVAASGTGAQQLTCLVDHAGVGISHCLGVGGRDLSAAVGGRATRQALRMLDDDDATELIVLVSKPPDPDVARDITTYAASLRTPVVLALLGEGQDDLTAVARDVVQQSGVEWHEPWSWDEQPGPAGGTALRGLFSGGTLCDEAMVIASRTLGAIRSNIPLRPEWALGADLAADGEHVMVDFGDDALTRGRAHPMIDQRLRAERIRTEGADPTCGVLLLDVVLGHGAHDNPAGELAEAVAAARASARDGGREVAVVVSLCATLDDPQQPRRQADILHEAGASVWASNAAAARHAVSLVEATR